MSLPDDEEVKDYLRLETDEEDTLIEQINASAQAFVASYLRVPLTSRSRVFKGRKAQPGPREEPRERLTIPVQPCSTTAVITDMLGETVADDTYEIDPLTGYVDAVLYESFGRGPYAIDTSVGWQEHPNYHDDVDPLLHQVVLHICSDYYHRRNSGAIYEQSGGQVSITYTEDQIPPVIKSQLEQLRNLCGGRAW